MRMFVKEVKQRGKPLIRDISTAQKNFNTINTSLPNNFFEIEFLLWYKICSLDKL